jgi:hypothetical protein
MSQDERRPPPEAYQHHRAFVGQPQRYDVAAASQFALLFLLGLREHHRVLDFGCGSLRLGRLLIPYLGGIAASSPRPGWSRPGSRRNWGRTPAI